MAIARRIPSRFLQFLVVLILLITLGGAENAATAQSPVAEQLPIKVVRIFERLCPASVDPSAGTWRDARTSCPDVADGMIFTLTSDDSSYPQIPLTVSASGAVEWPEVPSGMPFTIAHGGSFEFGAAWVACQFIGNLDPAVQDTERIFWAPEHSISIGASEPALSTYRVIDCYWFDMPKTAGVLAEPEATATSTPNPAVDVADTSNAGVLAEEEAAPTATPNPNSEVADTANAGVQAEPDTSAAGTPESGAISPADTSIMDTTNAGVQTEPDAGAHVDVQLYVCPFHSDAHLQAIPACGSTLQGSGFTINGDAATTLYTTSGGFALFTGVPFGEVTITALKREHWDTARVFCHTQSATAAHGPINPANEIPFTSGPDDTFSVTLTVQPGERIDCRWFDTTVTESYASTVLLHEFICSPGVNTATGGLAELRSGCATPQGNGYFVVDSYPKMGGRTNGNGDRSFLNVTSTTFPLTATQPLGYVTKRVFCVQYHASDWDHITESYAEVPVTAPNSITVSLQPQWEIDCYWFVQEGTDYAFLDITARSCPLNFNPAATTPRNTFAQQCSVGLDGVPFDVAAEFGYDFATNPTSVAGTAYFQQPVPPAPLTITGGTPNTHRYLRAFCGSAPYVGIGAIPTTWTSFSSLQTIWTAKANDQVVCEFYYQPLAIAAGGSASPESVSPATESESNPSAETDAPADVIESNASPESDALPEAEIEIDVETPTPSAAPTPASTESETQPASDTSATLLLNLHTCPIGYDVYAPGADPAVDCAAATGAPDVTVNGTASETSADGMAGWTTLLPGAALIQSQRPAFLGTCFSDARTLSSDGAVTPFVFTNANGAVGISLLGGETLTCDWYILDDRDPGTVSATLLSCPGTTVIEAQCTPAAGPATLHFEPVSDNGNAFDLEIDASGAGQASATGTYQLAEFPTGTCSIESDAFDATGALVIDPGAIVEVRIYLCGG